MITESFTQGSSMISISPAEGIRAGLSTARTGPPPMGVTRYSTDGADAISSSENSRSRRSWTISMWRRPRNPQRKPKPRAIELSASNVKLGVVEVQLLHRVAKQRVVLARDRVDPREDEALGGQVAGQRRGRRHRGIGDRVAHLRVPDALEPGGDVADLAGGELPDRDELRAEDAQLEDLGLRAGAHQPDARVLVDRPFGQADVGHHALVLVVVGVEHEPAKWRVRVPLRGRDAGDDRLEDLHDPRALLRGRQEHLLAGDRQDVLQLIHHHVGLQRTAGRSC